MPTLIEEIGVKQGEERRGHRPGPGEVGDAYPDLQVNLRSRDFIVGAHVLLQRAGAEQTIF